MDNLDLKIKAENNAAFAAQGTALAFFDSIDYLKIVDTTSIIFEEAKKVMPKKRDIQYWEDKFKYNCKAKTLVDEKIGEMPLKDSSLLKEGGAEAFKRSVEAWEEWRSEAWEEFENLWKKADLML